MVQSPYSFRRFFEIQESKVAFSYTQNWLDFAVLEYENENIISCSTHSVFLSDDNQNESVKPLDIVAEYLEKPLSNLWTTSIMPSADCFVRQVTLPVKRQKDIDATLPFQLETLLPYPIEDAVFDKIISPASPQSTLITVFSTQRHKVQKLIDFYLSKDIDLDAIKPQPAALMAFSQHFLSSEGYQILINIDDQEACCLLIHNNQLVQSVSVPCLTLKLLRLGSLENILQKEKNSLESAKNFVGEIKAFCLELVRVIMHFNKADLLIGQSPVWLTGMGSGTLWFVEQLQDVLKRPVNQFDILSNLMEPSAWGKDYPEIFRYASLIGACLQDSRVPSSAVDLQDANHISLQSWKKLCGMYAIYVGLVVILAISFKVMTGSKISQNEAIVMNQLKSIIHQASDISNENSRLRQIVSDNDINNLSLEDLENKLVVLEKELQAEIPTYPLHPDVPKAFDVLAWIVKNAKKVSYQNVKEEDSIDNDLNGTFKIESFSYTMLKRPEQSSFRDKYQVKIEMEFSSSSQRIARAFHELLITSNEFVDPKSEVKWTPGQGKYRVAFILKDRTYYPAGG